MKTITEVIINNTIATLKTFCWNDIYKLNSYFNLIYFTFKDNFIYSIYI